MPTNSYTASLNYYDSSYGWANEGTCSQGNCTPWGGGSARTGVMYFSGLSSLKGKIINSVTFTVTNGESGYGYDAYKTAQFYRSARQGGISTSLGASHKTGGVIGTWRNMFHALNGTTMSFNPTFFSSHIKNGDDTFCIYSNDASDYFKWKKVQISVNWSEPYTTTTGWSVTSSIALGSSGTVSMPSLSGSNANNYHTVTYQTSAGGYSGTISSRLTSGQSATFAPSLSWAAAIPSSTAMTCTITTTTYTSSGSWVGANSKTITLTVPDNSSTKPSCSVSATAVDPAGNDAYVSGFSQVQANMHNMAGQYGASVRTYSISMTGWSTSGSVSGSSMTATSPILSGSGSRTITLTVTDSRGFSNSATTSFTVLSYTRPLITSFQAFRTSSSTSTTQDLTGSYLRVVIQLAPSSPSISGNTHTGTLSCSPSVSGMPSSVTSNYSQNFSVSNGASYNLSFTYGDEYSKSTATVSVSSVAVPLDIRFNGTAIGIGKYAESNNMVDIGLNTRIREDLQVDGSLQSVEDLIPRGKANASANPIIFVSTISYSIIEPNHDTKTYFQNWLKWICANYPNRANATFLGACHPNSLGTIICFIYDTAKVNSEGLPEYACGQYTAHGSNIYTFGTSSHTFYWGAAVNAMTWDSITGKPSTFPPAAHTQTISQGGTGATSASGALSNLGAMPLNYGQSVALWTGTCNRGGSVTIPNANKYGALIVYCTPGSGESEVITCIYRARGYKFQIASNQAYCMLSATNSGDNKVFTVDSGSSSGATLNGVYGLSRFKA